ncbi:ATP-binding protein [uncultured Pseudoteredinibacter sp.]|uniref:ATP-binding protein n=1 Tax=uncultured Pseudoteredinibacter sp. TaxID=1641701 RepID=UPI002624FCF4|nr:ATP-binding protein [uncultured Pseudoteredinibacter sp.]
MENVEDTVIANEPSLGLLDLTRLIPKGGLDEQSFYPLAIDMATSLSSLHEEGIYHSCLRPEKFLCDRNFENLNLINIRPRESVTKPYANKEDVHRLCQDSYLAPEQKALINEPQGPLSDIFSLALCWYFVLCGQELIPRGLTSKDSVDQLEHLSDKIKTLNNFSSSRVSRPLIYLLRNMLCVHPLARPQTVKEIVGRLKQLSKQNQAQAEQANEAILLDKFHRELDRTNATEQIMLQADKAAEGIRIVSIESSSGNGKSTLCQNAAINVASKFTSVIHFTCKASQTSRPYFGLKQLLRQLRELLISHKDFNQWGDELIDALPMGGAYICHVLPEFKSLLPAEDINTESVFLRSRFIQQSIFSLFSVLSQNDFTTAIIIDDAEHLDPDSLQVLQSLWELPAIKMLALLAFNPGHKEKVEIVGPNAINSKTIELAALTESEAIELCENSFPSIRDAVEVKRLADILLMFSRGNLKLFKHYCALVIEQDLIDRHSVEDTLDLQKIEELQDVNVYEFYTYRLSILSQQAIKTMQYAELVHRTMPLSDISILKALCSGQSQALTEVFDQDLMYTLGQDFCFKDNIISRITSEYWGDEQLLEAHLLLWEQLRSLETSNMEDWLCCLNPVQHLIKDNNLKLQLLEHNYQFAEYCREMGAPLAAENYIRQAMYLLELYQLQGERQLCDALLQSYGEILAINGKLHESDELFHKVHDSCKDAKDQDTISLKQYELMVGINQALQSQVGQKKCQLADQQREINELKQELWETQNCLLESEKMAALGSLVAGITHEINTPVGISITGMSHFIDRTKQIKKNYYKQSMTQKELEFYFDSSEQAAEITFKNLLRAADLIRSFKRISADQSTEHASRFNLVDYINEILLSLSSQYSKRGITVELKQRKDIIVKSHPGWFSQIFTNLIMNSLIHAFEEGQKGAITIEVEASNDRLNMIYRDSGKGISEEQKRQIFDPFYTTNRDGGGTGLGMSVIWDIVTESLGGEIQCESALGQGVTFTMIIPFESLGMT